MPVKFSKNELNMIKSQLLVVGRMLFESQGFHKTTIDQLVDSVGIAKGSFYKFYDNKESLFYDILEKLEIDLHKDALIRLKQCDDLFIGMKELVIDQMDTMMKEPLLSVSMDTNFFVNIWKRLPENKRRNSENLDINKMHAVDAAIKLKGYTFTYDYKTTSGIFRSLVFTLLHKDMMGENHVTISDFYLDTVIKSIIKPVE